MKIPIWAAMPFLGVLLSIAIIPAISPRLWNKFRLWVIAVFSIPVLIMFIALDPSLVAKSFADYVSFICLAGALYAVGSGLSVSGTPKANPVTNLGYLAFGSLLANLIGTLGASMLLIRPLLRSNRGRKNLTHVIIFFIFTVSNIGGALTPLANSPLLFGYLLGVPFDWSMKIFPIWFFTMICLLGIFVALDSYFYLNDPDFRGPLNKELKEPLHITGRWNLALIFLVIAALLLPQIIPIEFEVWRAVVRILFLLLTVYISRKITPHQIDNINNFSWEPLKEVMVVFAGIFITMLPTLKYLEQNALSLGLNSIWGFYWSSGVLSSFFGSVPTYASFFAIAQGIGQDYSMLQLDNGRNLSEPILTAITCGTVFFAAMTYIGNAPNLLVKSVCEENHIKLPQFFGYLGWSLVFLLPVLFMTAYLFFEF